jgi:hypothetical protein
MTCKIPLYELQLLRVRLFYGLRSCRRRKAARRCGTDGHGKRVWSQVQPARWVVRHPQVALRPLSRDVIQDNQFSGRA